MTTTGRVMWTCGAALAGAAAGYVVGVLTAPASGRETRRMIGRRVEVEADEIRRRAERKLTEAQRRVAEAAHC